MSKDIVLSDNLLKIYYAFKNSESVQNNILEKLLSLYKPHLTNIEQLKRCAIIDSSLQQSLMSAGFTNQTLEELMHKTNLKIVLNEIGNDYPYVNINNDEIQSNYTATYYKGNRLKAKNHIKSLLKDAQRVFIYDKFITHRWDKSKNFFTDLMPKRNLIIYYKEKHLESKIQEIKKIYNWNIQKDITNKKHTRLHDRYLLIDSKIEVVLTSGFDNLFDESSDFTYIIRTINND